MPKDNAFTKWNKSLKELALAHPQYAAFAGAVERTEAKLASLSMDEKKGYAPLLTEEDCRELKDLYMEVGKASSAAAKSEEDPVILDLVKAVGDQASRDFALLLDYDPQKDPMTMDDFLDKARSAPVKLPAGQVKTVGSNLSTRQVLTYLDDQGEKKTVLFTPEKKVNVVEEARNMLKTAAKNISGRDNKSIIMNLMDKYFEEKKVEKPKRQDVVDFICTFRNAEGDPDPRKLENLVNKLYPENLISSRSIKKACEATKPVFYQIASNHGVAKMSEEVRIDNRNAAMSTVAELLGVPGLVAKSRTTTIIGPDHTKIKGTMMEKAEGWDMSNLPPEAEKTGLSAGEGPQKARYIRDAADLQILDYICGNTDRHASNFTMKMEKGKLIGIQGFDNDCSFGTLVPQGDNGRLGQTPGPEKMLVISHEMADRVTALTPETLKFSLRGYGLSEEELEAAGKRLTQVREKVIESRASQKDFPGFLYAKTSGMLYECTTQEDYEALDFDKLSGNGIKDSNLFDYVRLNLFEMKDMYREQKRQKAYQSLEGNVIMNGSNRCHVSVLKEAHTQMKGLEKLMKDRTGWHWGHGTSPEYEAVRTLMGKYAKLQKTIADRVTKEAQEAGKGKAGAYVTLNDLTRQRDMAARLEKATEAYLKRHPGECGSYTRQRVDLVKQINAMAKAAKELKPEEKEMVEKNERLLMEDMKRQAGSISEKAARETGPKAKEAQPPQVNI